MAFRVRLEVRDNSGETNAQRQPMSLLDRLVLYSLLAIIVLFIPFLLASLLALISGSSSPDAAAGRIYQIALGWRTTTYYFVAPWFGQIYETIKIALEIAGGAFLLFGGLRLLFKRKNPPSLG